MSNYTEGLTVEQIREQIPQLEAQLARLDEEATVRIWQLRRAQAKFEGVLDNLNATREHLAALREAAEKN